MFKRKLLITGSRGLIGGLLREALSKSYDLYKLDQLPPTGKSGRTYHQADISDYGQVQRAVRAMRGLRYAVHLAAHTSHLASWNEVLGPNIVGTWNMYRALQQYTRVKRVVFASSNHATGMWERDGAEMVGPGDAMRPDGPYGISKLTGEAIARYFFDEFGIESVCLRIGSVLRDDAPDSARLKRTWLSHRDLAQLVTRGLEARRKPGGFSGFGIYYGVSDNTGRFWDIANAREELGYEPQDNAATR